ncbi:hypothetical protein SAMN04487785_11425 [Dyella jiangningensis]|uniref:hypothetical protein n=1 Tax=Dyella sp. AtDHG13 TaxID=1938897 RepID=UPI0008845761|nr:hypothetical protein [Dyella sp. AtDHG13]PXV54195.1 hypothetical protein BDW41_113148 [Dyella sp. AtDHG13]SDL04506.1 hypothetical protein SAMN04487785_11425 [Dyella jiangningensis]
MSALQDYAKAMVRSDINRCIDIEIEHQLYGYPPELVSVGLEAIQNGLDAEEAIATYTNRGAES